MRILIVSDTHGHCDNLEKILLQEDAFDAMIHCGDVEGSEDYINEIADCPVYMVAGNNDFFSDLPDEIEEVLDGLRFFISHGHRYRVSMELDMIYEEGASRRADVVLFGHTHRPLMKRMEDLLILNPGSLSYPRQQGRKPTYIIMETDVRGNMEVHFYELREGVGVQAAYG